MSVTVKDVCDFFLANNRTTDLQRFWPRIERLMENHGDVPIAELRRQQIWECFGGTTLTRGWPYLRDSLEAVKRVFGFAAKPREGWRSRPRPAPLISRFDNPLDDVVVNLRKDSPSTKASRPTKELIFEMTVNSEANWHLAQHKRKAIDGQNQHHQEGATHHEPPL